ncbi:MAG: hypothetical protein SOX32_08670, partial [Candidatus Choladocola sp.]|nr:hypothetical protein [Candidatus Choladocola sp.]
VRSRMNITGSVARAASCAFSPFSILLGYQKTYLICAVVDAVSLLTVHGMQEARVTVNQKTSRETPFEQIGKRMKEHVIETLKFIRKHPVTMCKLLADAAIACPCYLTMMYLQEHLVSNGWPESLIGLPILLIPLSGAAGSWMASRICDGLFGIVVICGIVGGIGTCLAGSSILAVSMAGGCLAWIVSGYAEIVVGENVNRDFTSDQRATMVSVDSMMYSVLMVIVSPLTGYAGSHMSVSVSFYLMGAGLIGMTCILCGLYRICSKFSLR